MMSSVHRSHSYKKITYYNMWGFIVVPFLRSTIWQDTDGVGKLFLSKDSGSGH